MNSQYRIEEVPLPKSLEPEEKNQIQHLTSGFLKKELKLEILPTRIILYLAQVDLDKLKRNRLKLLQGKVNDNEKNIIKDIVNTIIERVESIGSYGIKSGKRVFSDYSSERKVKHRKTKQIQRGFHYYTSGHDFKETNQEFPSEMINQIVCGDSELILKRLPENSVDLILTSPPYNFGLEYQTASDSFHWEKYFEKLFHILQESIRVLKYGGRFILNIQPLFSDYIPSHHVISNFMMNQKMIWKGEVLWEKHNYNCKYTSWGSYKSPSSPYLKYTWEFLEIFSKGTIKKTGRKEDIDITGEEFKNWVNAKWSIAPEKKMKVFDHPAMFPEKLVERVLKLFSYQNDIILDPFNGVGTTSVVAKKLNRRYLGIDVSDKYCKTAETRLEQI